MRIRALFNETDIGNVHPGEPANVTVDAYPDRRFSGVVEKIEPQAVVQQNVTMFPVLVNLDNPEGLLKPGMNGEVAVLIDERDDVLAIPNDAIKNPREAVADGRDARSERRQRNKRARGAGLHAAATAAASAAAVAVAAAAPMAAVATVAAMAAAPPAAPRAAAPTATSR